MASQMTAAGIDESQGARFTAAMSPSGFVLSRRTVVGGISALSALPFDARAAAAYGIIAGTYTNEGGRGLVPLAANGEDWVAAPAIAGIQNASFGVKGTRHGLRYLLDEQESGSLGVYDRALQRVATYSTLGASPCYAALSPDQSALAVANYSSGSVALWSLNRTTGMPQGAAQLIPHEGQGPNRERQTGPHAHWVGFTADGRVLHSVDLGADAIFAHHYDPQARHIHATSIAYRAEPGSGPRHLARHPRLPVAYLVAELANTVTLLVPGTGATFAARAVMSTLPTNFQGKSAAAHIALNRAGTRLYVSNRGHDSIAVFAVGTDGALSLLQHIGCQGRWPRLFLLLEDRGEMLIADERSGNVAILRIADDGRLSPTGRSIAVPGVVFLAV